MSSSYRVPTTLSAVRDYVSSETNSLAQSSDTALLRVTHSNLSAVFPEIRLSRSMTIGEVKAKLYAHIGTRPAFMRLVLLRGGRDEAVPLIDESRMLGYYSPAATGDTLRVLDDDPHSASRGGWLEDTSLVEKFELTDEQYAARPDSYAKFRDRMRKKDASWTMNGELAKKRGEVSQKPSPCKEDVSDEPPAAKVGDRVEVTPGGKRGVVRYVGRDLSGLPPGWWIGICYDEPVGKNDGEVKGVRYFSAPRMHGGLARPSKVAVGDYPPLDDELLASDDEDEI